jgi:phage N-6-adenine-methyltransferase
VKTLWDIQDALPPERRSIHFSSKTETWETPQDFFDALDREFGFETDVCALPENAKCRRYFTPDVDGLKQTWRGVCWMNPPYGRVIAAWMKKAFESAQEGATVVALVPARTDTRWWHDYAKRSSEIRFVKGRLRFGDAAASAPFPSALVVFRPRRPSSGNGRRAPLVTHYDPSAPAPKGGG